MHKLINNLPQPIQIGDEQTLAAGEQIDVETVTKQMRSLETRGFVAIVKIENAAVVKVEDAAPDAKPSGNQPKEKK